MADLTQNQIYDLINGLTHRTTAQLLAEAQKLVDDGHSAPLTTSIVMDAALMAAASFIQTAVFSGSVRTAMPIEELLRLRLNELLAMPVRIFPQLADGSFDPVGQALN